MRKRWLLLGLCAALVAFIAVGCPGQEPDVGEDPGGDEPVNKVEAITAQWEDSAHAMAVEAAVARDGCLICHNADAFQAGATAVADVGGGDQADVPSADCETCHQDRGKQIKDSGIAETPYGQISFGSAALCASCHNGRGKGPNLTSAPHASVQLDMLIGIQGAEVEDHVYYSSAHAGISSSCNFCHMTDTDDDFASHTFAMSNDVVEEACGGCHEDLDTLNREAKGDFDGDGDVEGTQDEVNGLLEAVESAINDELDGGSFETNHGQIVFTDSAGTQIDPPSEALYNAAWNLLFVRSDGSRGIHNTTYTVQLLQQSLMEVTGEELPEADIR